ncbi:MAG TPA: TonB-dependent receptor [Caulobacteraceae bacterium]|nr:TonB-dependent receptor [Caulobacteraceae bacterium]
MSILGRNCSRGLCRTLVAGLALALFGGAAFAQNATHPYNIPSEDMADALNAFAHQSGLRILFPYGAVAGKRNRPLTGTMSEQAALDRLLAGAGLVVVSRAENVLTLGPAPVIEAARPEPPVEVQEVVVTAEKRVELLKDVPMSMTALSGDALTQTEADTLQDVVDRAPGVQLIASSAITNELVIRGLSVGAGINSSVATYVDETPYSTVGPFAYSTNLAPNFDTYDLARVEILRGPQGTLYGANALGGLLKYVTNAPDLSRYSASMLAGVSAVDHSDQTGWDVHGMVNLPLGDDAALRIVGDEQFFPGYIDDPSRGVSDINWVRRYGGRASLLWRPSQDLSVRLSADVQHITAGDTGVEDLAAATLKPLYGELMAERTVAQPQVLTNAIYNATIDWSAGFGTLVSSTSFSQVNPNSWFDLSWVYHSALDNKFGGNLGAVADAIEPVQSFTQELRFSSPKNQTLEWIVGIFFDAEAADEHEPLFPVDIDTGQVLYNFIPDLGAYQITSTYREYAGFADLTYHVTPALELSLGGRYSANSQSYHQVNAGVFTGTDDFRTYSRQSVFTYSADAKYRFNPQTMVYVRIASGFVPGGPNDVLPGSPLPATYRSSSTTNYEAGIKGAAMRGRLTYDLDVFDVEWQDIQLIAQVSNLYGATNGGAARSRGVEGSLSLRPIRGLTLGLDGAYIDARLTRNTPATFGGVAGDRLPLSPQLSGAASAAYERPLSPSVSGFAGIDWRYDGGRISEFEFGAPRQELPAYSMLDLRLGLKFEAYTLTAYVKNATSGRAFSSVVPETLGGVNALAAFVANPHTIGLTLAAKF